MNDPIWIGNTLFPRWEVLIIAGAIGGLIGAIAIVVARRFVDWMIYINNRD